MSMMPKQFVQIEEYTGETEQVKGAWKKTGSITAPVAEVSVQIGDLTLKRRAAVVEGETLE